MAEVERVGSKTITETGEFAMTPRRRRHSKTNPPLHGIDTPALPLRLAPGAVVAGGGRGRPGTTARHPPPPPPPSALGARKGRAGPGNPKKSPPPIPPRKGEGGGEARFANPVKRWI